MTWSFDLANLNKSSSHLIWCDVVAATTSAADQYADALQVAAAGDRQTATRAPVAIQSEWRDALRASATERIGVKAVRRGEGPERHTSDYVREQELAGWLKDVAKRVKEAMRLHLAEAVMLMTHSARQRVVRGLAMSGVGDDLYNPQSPLVHAVEAALMLDPLWHDPSECEGCNQTGKCY